MPAHPLTQRTLLPFTSMVDGPAAAGGSARENV
jgi:hypothetical protein